MMISKYAVSLLFICIFLLGCNSEDEQCSSPEVQTSIHNILTENTLKLTHKKRDEFFDGPALFGLDKIKATLALINIEVDHIKFVKRIQETQAVVCEAQLKITVPPPLLDDVDLTRRIQHQSKIIDFAKQLNIENHLNAFTQKVNYSVKSSKDITTVSVGFEGTQWEQLLDEMVTAVLLMSTLDANEVQPQAQAQHQPQAQPQPQPQAQAQRQTTVQRPEPIITKSKVIEVQPVKPIANAAQSVVPDSAPLTTPKTQLSPSFDCTQANKATDVTICAQPSLVTLDIQNMSIYKSAKELNPLATKDVWKESIKYKYACGTDVACIAGVYKKSIQRYQCITKQQSCEKALPY